MVLIVKSHDKYQSMILIGLAPVEKASSENRSISIELERVVTSGDPLGRLYKRGH